MNETIQSILGRRSVRSYAKTPVEKEKVDLILECGRYAPSGMNRQPWHFTVVTNRKLLGEISAENRKILMESPDENMKRMADDPDFDNFRGAPMAVIASGLIDADGAEVDCANAVENMAVAAYSLGLGSCYIASFRVALEEPRCAYLLEELKIPQGYKPYFALSLGYGNEELGERQPRKGNEVTLIR